MFNGGLDSIIVSDDGEGMSPEDLAMAVRRQHQQNFRRRPTTSLPWAFAVKLCQHWRCSVDYNHPAAGGCRRQLPGGLGGEQGEVKPAASPQGTRIEVRDLFFNTPARKKFLRKSSTEFTAIAEVVHQLLLAKPGISFKLHHNGKMVLSSPGSGSLRDAIACLAGTAIADNLLECYGSAQGYTISGYIVSSVFHRSNRAMQYFTVNNSPVSLRLAGSALERAYHTLLPVNRYPIAFLNLEVPSSQVDVNVHPAKREVKFSDASLIFSLVFRACTDALTTFAAAPPGKPGEQPVEYHRISVPTASTTPQAYKMQPGGRQVVQEAFDTSPAVLGEDYTILGQVFSTFLVVSTPRAVPVISTLPRKEVMSKYLQRLREGTRPTGSDSIETLSGCRQFVRPGCPADGTGI